MPEALEARKLSYTYPKSKTQALRRVDLHVKKGEFVVIVGPTGAGKTTFCLTLNGVIPHHLEGKISGNINVLGMNTLKTEIQELASKAGLVFQDPESQLFGTTVGDDVSLGPTNLSLSPQEVEERVSKALSETGMCGHETREPGTLSGGEKQKVAIAGILAMAPDILVLDEPTSELDPVSRQELIQIVKKLRKKGKTIVMVEHNTPEIAKYADRVVVIEKGKIVLEGKPREVFSKVEKLKEIGVRVPQVCELAARLKKAGLLPMNQPIPLSVEEACAIKKNLPEEKQTAPVSSTEQEEKSGEVMGEVKVIVRVEDLHHVYPKGVKALKGVTFNVRKGDYLAIIGQNGSGKTTLAKHLNGLLKPTKGRVLVKNVDTRERTVAKLSRIVGYVFQNPDHQIFNSSVKEELAYGLKNMGLSQKEIDARCKKILKIIGLEGEEKEFPFNLGKGERQKLALGSILAMEPDVLVIDEPTTGLDLKGSKKILDLIDKIHKEGHTMIIITHDMELIAERAKRVLALQDGQILLRGSTREVFSKPEILEKSFLRPPQVTELAQKMWDSPQAFLNVDEMVAGWGVE